MELKGEEFAMRHLALALICSGSLLSAGMAWGQEAASPRALPDMAGQLPEVNFSVRGGRISVETQQDMLDRSSTLSDSSGLAESLSISSNGNHRVSLKYDKTTSSEKLHVEIAEGERIAISRRPIKEAHATTVDFRQPDEGPLTLTVVQDGVAREIKGETLWHLLLAEPALCRRHLLPLLEMFRPDWRLSDAAAAIASQTMRTAEAYQPENLQRWAGWVADLAADRFAVRERADHQLRGAGPAVIPYLDGLDRKKLDFEQWTRIRRIVDSQADEGEDTPAAAARQLMGDRSLWLAYLSRPDEKVRRVAARQLGFLLGGPIEFDPAGPEATRRAQVESLRQRIEAVEANATRSE
jgi:hypothetical protein